MLHVLFQRHHIPPHTVFSLPHKFKLFMYASMMLVLEDEKKESDKAKRKKGRK